ncbi:MAG TPA: hypothetical protein VK724_26830, partial [Bryobacteraceae bacterium]|nr:hypothetical protein [Bryobacteraceae bacterium]
MASTAMALLMHPLWIFEHSDALEHVHHANGPLDWYLCDGKYSVLAERRAALDTRNDAFRPLRRMCDVRRVYQWACEASEGNGQSLASAPNDIV